MPENSDTERSDADVILTYGWECITCGADENGIDDEYEAEKQRKHHDCDEYWEGRD